MKLRIEGNSIRLRVKKSDLEKLKNEGVVRESVSFLKGFDFHYELKTENGITQLNAVYTHSTITIELPLSIANNWIDTEQVGIENTLSMAFLYLLKKISPVKHEMMRIKMICFKS